MEVSRHIEGRQTLAGVAATEPRPVDLLIAGQGKPSRSGATFPRISPICYSTVSVAAAATPDDAMEAANAAASAFPQWSRSSPNARRTILERAGLLLLERKPDFVEAMMTEIGATALWSEFNVDLASKILIDAAAMTTQVSGLIIPTDRESATSFAVRQPAGVCLAIAPWNAPIILGVRSFAVALACGNTVVMKSSELCPATHRLLGEILLEAGLPPGVLNIVSNAPSEASTIVETLVAHPAVRRVNFTGSTRVGKIIAQMAAKHLKRCLLELGGKAPFIVLDDANIDDAVDAAAFGAFFNQGQLCMSTERIIVMDEVADAFIEKFVARAKTLRSGDPAQQRFPLGSLITAESARRIRSLIEDAVSKGAVIRAGGEARDAFMDATIIDDVSRSMRIYQEESFGPVAAIIRVGSIQEAITIANDCEYGLSAAVFGKDVRRAMDVAMQLETGICHINSATVADEPQAPFGGVKASGYGKFGGLAALDEFTELRWITTSSRKPNYQI